MKVLEIAEDRFVLEFNERELKHVLAHVEMALCYNCPDNTRMHQEDVTAETCKELPDDKYKHPCANIALDFQPVLAVLYGKDRQSWTLDVQKL